MTALKIFGAGVAGTSFMTIFSYIASAKRKKDFREPELLNNLIGGLFIPKKVVTFPLAGWLLHYFVGLSFSSLFDQVWRRTRQPHPKSGLALGLAAGIIGTGIWKFTFKMHPNPPVIDFKAYYKQLLVAHLIFGLFASLGYNQVERWRTLN